jgi:hypothetical protein
MQMNLFYIANPNRDPDRLETVYEYIAGPYGTWDAAQQGKRQLALTIETHTFEIVNQTIEVDR